MKKCLKCDLQFSDDDAFCGNCGGQLESISENHEDNKSVAIIYCELCGQPQNSANKFCEECGHNLHNEAVEAEEAITETASAIEKAYCERCGYLQPADNVFCEHCGAPFNQEDLGNHAESSAGVIGSQSEIDSTSNDQKEFVAAGRTRKSNKQPANKKKITAIIISVLLIILGSASIYYGYTLLKPVEDKKVTVSDESSEESKKESSEEVEESSSEEPEEETVAYDDEVMGSKVQELFNTDFTIGGKHSYYYHRLTDEAGEVIDALAYSTNGGEQMRAASVIKIFILLDLYKQSEEGLINLDDVYSLRSEDIVGGTGNIQAAAIGTEYTYKELAVQMIINSDNTASNIIIDRIGGLAEINQFIQSIGCTNSSINRKLMDSNALNQGIDNYVSADDLGNTLSKLYQQQLISPAVDKSVLAILGKQVDREKLMKNIPLDVMSYNKTGQFSTYGTMNDASIVETTKGTYVLVALTSEGNYNEKTQAMVNFGSQVYQAFMNN